MAIDAASLTGGCQCGAVRYRLDGEPAGANICHCRDVPEGERRARSWPSAACGSRELVVDARRALDFASSDIAERGFCAECGTPLTYRGLGADRIA